LGEEHDDGGNEYREDELSLLKDELVLVDDVVLAERTDADDE
jgi:hypothetical protein